MKKLIIISIILRLLVLSSAKSVFLSDGHDNDLIEHFDIVGNDVKVEPVWVLSLSEGPLELIKLRPASDEEVKRFESKIGPLKHALDEMLLYTNSVKKDDPNKVTNTGPHKSQSLLIQEISHLLNKLRAWRNNEDVDNVEDASTQINLYFQGQYSILSTGSSSNRRSYVINPGSLPEWFYEDHRYCTPLYKIEDNVEIPNEIRTEFFKSLLDLLQHYIMFSV